MTSVSSARVEKLTAMVEQLQAEVAQLRSRHDHPAATRSVRNNEALDRAHVERRRPCGGRRRGSTRRRGNGRLRRAPQKSTLMYKCGARPALFDSDGKSASPGARGARGVLGDDAAFGQR